MSDIAVSVICNAYNHELYIRDALEGFVMQETSFPFEILIHDDASTDKTADIIREYEQRYPNLIKPIYQTENQYSQKNSPTLKFQLPRALGKYVAFCEGDDYWTDPLKLQKQFDAMEAHPEIGICAHCVEKQRDGKREGYIAPKEMNTIIPMEEVILGGGGYVGTQSLMLRTDVMKQTTPMLRIMTLDYVWQLQGSLPGGMLYLNDCMAVYRVCTQGSWTSRMQGNTKVLRKHNHGVQAVLNAFDEYTNRRYSDVIEKKINELNFSLLALDGDYQKMLSKEYRDVFHRQRMMRKLKIVLNAFSGHKR